MKLVTFQSYEAFLKLVNKGYIECEEQFLDKDKSSFAYDWISREMNKRIVNKYGNKYPMWCWVKFKNGICPPKHKGKSVKGFDVKITFNKKVEEVFITDFRRYSFLLHNRYIPKDRKDKERFDKKLEKCNVSNTELEALARKDKYDSFRTDEVYKNICCEIENSFLECITNKSDVLQGCVYRINMEDVVSIEFLKDDGYCYGSFNYVRSNGKRFDWINDFYNRLP